MVGRRASEHWIFVVGWLSFGGAQRQSLHFADYLLREHAKVTFIGLSSPGLLLDECLNRGIPCHYFPLDLEGRLTIKKLLSLLKFLRFVVKLNPTYLAPYCMLPNIACGIIWRLTGAKNCVWQQRDEGRLRQNRILEIAALALTKYFISNSFHAAEWLISILKVPSKNISIICNGICINDTVPRGSFRRLYGISQSQLMVVKIANLHKYKDHLTLLKAWKNLLEVWDKRELPMLILAGAYGDTYPQIKQFIDQNSLRSSILCTGFIQDIPSLLMDADLMVFSSVTEGCPNAVLEGMAAGLAVVGVDTDAIREAVGETGASLLSSPRDVIGLSKNINLALNNRDLRAKHALANQERISLHFSISNMCESSVRVFLRS